MVATGSGNLEDIGSGKKEQKNTSKNTQGYIDQQQSKGVQKQDSGSITSLP